MSSNILILLNIAFEWNKLSETRVVTQILVLALVIGKGEEWKMKQAQRRAARETAPAHNSIVSIVTHLRLSKSIYHIHQCSLFVEKRQGKEISNHIYTYEVVL